ncbi:transposase [Kutzneria albida]|uniref:transposase n=1 Tax=Kutzneria albida TaxID=43357 RepID=UPI003B82F9E6
MSDKSARTHRQGRPFADARSMVEGIIYRYRCGIAWRDVPAVFGPWQTIWTWHRRLSVAGTWDALLTRLLAAVNGTLSRHTSAVPPPATVLVRQPRQSRPAVLRSEREFATQCPCGPFHRSTRATRCRERPLHQTS